MYAVTEKKPHVADRIRIRIMMWHGFQFSEKVMPAAGGGNMHIFSGEKFMYSGKAAISKRSCRTERKDFIPAGTVSRRMNAISKKRFWLGPKDDRCVVKTVKKRLMMTHCAPSKAVNINIFYCSTQIRALWKQFNRRLELIK